MLYVACPIDLRDRFKGSVWLAYAGKVQETEFHASDTLVVCEWMFPRRDTLLQTLGRVRQSGARVVLVGQSAKESDDFKRELCILGIYDFLFVVDELVLSDLDALLEHGRSKEDVVMYLHHEEDPIAEPPKLVDVFEGKDEPFLWTPLEGSDNPTNSRRFDNLLRPDTDTSSSTEQGRRKERSAHRFVWPDPAPLRVRILGEQGCGKSFVALQIASLCQEKELPAAVVEGDPATLNDWCEEPLSSHVFATDPPKGYRVILDTRSEGDTPLSDIDLILVVTWPDAIRIKETLQALENQTTLRERVLCIVNHCSEGLIFESRVSVPLIHIPHEPRQFHAIRMRMPLVQLDPRFAHAFLPIIERISMRFIDPSRHIHDGGDLNAVADGV